MDAIAYRPPRGGMPRVCFRDRHLLVVDKPAGLLSVPGRGERHQDCLLHRVRECHPGARVVHRLDMDTSGLLVFALHPEAQSRLSRAFQTRQVAKHYLAVVAGRPPGVRGAIDLPLAADWPNRPRQVVDRARGRAALTRWELLGYDPIADRSRLLLRPVTGRSHQLRVHLQSLGHPILGDPLYADPAARHAAPRLLLHARRLAFEHPLEPGRWLDVWSPEPF